MNRIILLLLVVCQTSLLPRWSCVSVTAATSDVDDHNNDYIKNGKFDEDDITIIGLGSMGSAVAKCLASRQQQQDSPFVGKIHGWNRGIEKRQAHADILTIHDTIEEAIEASTITLFMIDDWKSLSKLILDHAESLFTPSSSSSSSSSDNTNKTKTNRTIVVFSTYSPLHIKELETQLLQEKNNYKPDFKLKLVGGAVVGVPETICTPMSLILSSSSSRDVQNVLKPLGRNIYLVDDDSDNDDKEEDVGLASLMNLALVMTINFGLAGHELAHLMIDQYDVPENFIITYQSLAQEVATEYTKMLMPMVSTAMTSGNFHGMYAPASAMLGLFESTIQLLKSIGIVGETFLDTYVESLRTIQNPQRQGPSAWTMQQQVQQQEDVKQTQQQQDL